jgi:hypothetical protein
VRVVLVYEPGARVRVCSVLRLGLQREHTPRYSAVDLRALPFSRPSLGCLFPEFRYRQHVLGNVVAMYHAVHAAGCDANNEDGQNEAPMMDTMVALRLSIALMHCRKQQHMLVRNRYF